MRSTLTTARGPRACTLLGVVACLALSMTGCMQRSLVITSEPAGATVYVNDAEVGRTPLEVGFTYYGTYDVLVTKDGYEPLRTKAEAIAPVYEHPPLDLAAHAMPWGVRTRVPWHFTLEALATSPEAKKAQETALLERAAATRARLQPGGGVRATASPD